jgi:hypothetical protein
MQREVLVTCDRPGLSRKRVISRAHAVAGIDIMPGFGKSFPNWRCIVEQAERKSFDRPDEVREFPKGRVEILKVGGTTVGRAIFEPGWRWATSVQPLAKTPSCQAPHFQYHVAGTLVVRMDDGTELTCGPGDVSFLPSGHDAWVVGDEPAVIVDFHGMLDYARKK